MNITQLIAESVSKALDHPHHAFATSAWHDGDEHDLLTGHGTTKTAAKEHAREFARHETLGKNAKHYDGQPYDPSDDNDVEANDELNTHQHFKVSDKAYNHMKSNMSSLAGHERDDDAHEHLNFDWKNKTIKHKSE